MRCARTFYFIWHYSSKLTVQCSLQTGLNNKLNWTAWQNYPHCIPEPSRSTDFSSISLPSIHPLHKNTSLVFKLPDRVRCLLCSIVQKGAHKWNIKWHYDTVLCSKSAADAANLSIFTLRHVHCGLRCATSSWGNIKYMIADACCTQLLIFRVGFFGVNFFIIPS